MRKVQSLQQVWVGTGLVLLSAFGHPITVSVSLGAIATLALALPVEAAVLTRWQFDPNARQLEITVPEGVTPRYFLLAQPARIVLDLPNTSVGSVPESQTYAGAVRQIRVGEFQPGLTRIVIELSPDAVLATGQVELRQVEGTSNGESSGSHWILRPLLEGNAAPIATRPQPASSMPPTAPRPTPPTPTTLATPLTPAAIPTAPPAATSSTADLPDLAPAPPLAPADLPPPEPSSGSVPTVPTPTALATPSPVTPVPGSVPTTPADASSHLPPLEPNALEIPIAPPRAAVSPQPAAPDVLPHTESPQALQPAQLEPSPVSPPDSTPTVEPAVVPDDGEARSPETLPLTSLEATAPPPSLRADPIPARPSQSVAASPAAPSSIDSSPPPAVLPPFSSSGNQPVTVRVPPLSPNPGTASGTANTTPPVRQTPPSMAVPSPAATLQPSLPPAVQPAPAAIAAQPTPPALLPPAVLPTNSAARVTVPPLEPASGAMTVPAPPASVAPLQNQPAVPTQQAAVSNPAVLIPSGTVLSLRYPRDTVLQLQTGDPLQEVLVVAQEVRDRSGTVLVPEGSQVIGRFETTEQGSRFVAQAITVQGRNVQLRAQSEVLAGDRQLSDDNLVRNSAIGGAAFTVLGILTGGIGFLAGALAGAAAGAATTYITAPQPAIIQPNQVVEVRLFEDVPRAF